MSSIARPRRSARMGNRKPAATGTGCKPQLFIEQRNTRRGYRINPATGLRVAI